MPRLLILQRLLLQNNRTEIQNRGTATQKKEPHFRATPSHHTKPHYEIFTSIVPLAFASSILGSVTFKIPFW